MSPARRPTPTHNGRCTSSRVETTEATAPGGAVLAVVRCLDCAGTTVSDTGRTSDSPDAMGAATTPDPKATQGPEDALGDEPTRGDYTDRVGAGMGSVTIERDAEGTIRRKTQHPAGPKP